MTEPDGANVLGDAAAPPRGGDSWAAVSAGFLGWAFDAFDFFLVTLCAPSIATTFGVKPSDVQGATAITLAARPAGAIIFGMLADRYGRRRPLMANLVFYSVMSILSGMAPTFGLFIAARFLFGVGMGGEWGVGASLAMEKVPPRWRGVMSGVLQEGYMFGSLLAAGAIFFLLPHLPSWRPLFFIGGVPALLCLFIRFRVGESEVWERTRTGEWHDWRSTLLANWRPFLLIVGTMWVMNLASHGTQDGYTTFLKTERHYTQEQAAGLAAIGSVGAICGGILFGLFSDRIGRRRAMQLAFAGGILVIPLYVYSPTTALLALGGFLTQFMVQGAWGVIPAHITELSPDKVRGFLPGFGYQVGVLLAGSIAYVQTWLSEHHVRFANSMAITAISVFVIAIVLFAFGHERRGLQFGTDTDGASPSRGFEVIPVDPT
jgi:SHS family lactate transporter-like MFS transporter